MGRYSGKGGKSMQNAECPSARPSVRLRRDLALRTKPTRRAECRMNPSSSRWDFRLRLRLRRDKTPWQAATAHGEKDNGERSTANVQRSTFRGTARGRGGGKGKRRGTKGRRDEGTEEEIRHCGLRIEKRTAGGGGKGSRGGGRKADKKAGERCVGPPFFGPYLSKWEA
jgi:hypothetical protein